VYQSLIGMEYLLTMSILYISEQVSISYRYGIHLNEKGKNVQKSINLL